MNKKLIMLCSIGLMSLLVVGLASAGILSDMFTSIKSQISTENKLIIKDAIPEGIPKEINITYSYTEDQVKWGAYIPNVLNTQDNVINRYWMNQTGTNETTGEAILERVDYSKKELAAMISNKIAAKLNAFAESSSSIYGTEEFEIVDLNN